MIVKAIINKINPVKIKPLKIEPNTIVKKSKSIFFINSILPAVPSEVFIKLASRAIIKVKNMITIDETVRATRNETFNTDVKLICLISYSIFSPPVYGLNLYRFKEH